MHLRLCTALLIVLVVSGTPPAAADDWTTLPPGIFQFKGTPEEKAACSPDATKFCSKAIPDTFRVLASLQQNRRGLSKTCAQVLAAHGQ
jgi:hypothetical protein